MKIFKTLQPSGPLAALLAANRPGKPLLVGLAASLAPTLLITLSLIAIVYIGFVALAQKDMKKLIAYSSVAHMGFVTMGIFAANQQGIDGAIFQMISHGFISGALFLCVGVIYDRMHTRDIDAYGGLVNRMPAYALVFMLFTMANVGLPGTSGFIGEFLTLVGIFQVNTWVALVATSGVILSAAYALWLYRRVVMGDLIKESLKSITDMTTRERAIFAPLVVMTLLLGVYPALVLDVTGPAVENLLYQYQAGLAAGGDAGAAGREPGQAHVGKGRGHGIDQQRIAVVDRVAPVGVADQAVGGDAAVVVGVDRAAFGHVGR